MYRGTTPTLIIKVNTDLNLINASQIWITLSSIPPTVMMPFEENEKITFDIDRIDFNEDGDIILKLTQEETLHLKPGKIAVQLRMIIDKQVYASDIVNFNIYDLLDDEVISQ